MPKIMGEIIMRKNRDFPDAQQIVVDRERFVAEWYPLLWKANDEDVGSGILAETMIDEREAE